VRLTAGHALSVETGNAMAMSHAQIARLTAVHASPQAAVGAEEAPAVAAALQQQPQESPK